MPTRTVLENECKLNEEGIPLFDSTRSFVLLGAACWKKTGSFSEWNTVIAYFHNHAVIIGS